jgi:hypothetical protein
VVVSCPQQVPAVLVAVFETGFAPGAPHDVAFVGSSSPIVYTRIFCDPIAECGFTRADAVAASIHILSYAPMLDLLRPAPFPIPDGAVLHHSGREHCRVCRCQVSEDLVDQRRDVQRRSHLKCMAMVENATRMPLPSAGVRLVNRNHSDFEQANFATDGQTAHHPATATDPQRIYELLFAGNIPDSLRGRFIRSWETLASDYSSVEHDECRRALADIHDLEALECFCRRCNRLPALSAQVALMAMLAETLPTHLPQYISVRDSRVRGLASILWAVSRTSWKFVKGGFLLWYADAKRRYHRR